MDVFGSATRKGIRRPCTFLYRIKDMMGNRQKLVSGDEHDCLFWRKMLKIYRKPGVAAWTKRKLRRRARHEQRQELKDGRHE